ncbi:MAG: AMP-dependent synthetase [Desulfobacteraceae bacterium 4572_88]|nr:MAG: AMP-dependent synthetase [Desulfobacteraceae bacterium 4572_88]
MKFIHQPQNSQENILTDGQQICTYQDIPKIFERIREFFDEKDIRIQYPLVLECENSLPGALLLLYLLEEGYSFLLIPSETKASRPDSDEYFPPFCRSKIRTDPVSHENTARFRPDDVLQVITNEKGKNADKADLADPKLYLRTSGSTGTPKMAVHSHARMRENALNCVRRLGIKSDHRIAVPVPVAHMYGLGAAFLPAVAVGAYVDLQKGANLLRYLQRERTFDPDTAFITPVFCETLLKGRRAARSYRLTVTAGDRFGEDTFARYESLFGPLINLYGSTEMGAMSAACLDDPDEIRSQTAGKPMPGVQIRLGKGDAEFTGDTEDTGELWCYHSYGFEGYIDEHGNPAGADPVGKKNWFRTKDMGRVRPDGSIEVMGRCDHSVNRDGLLVSFADVENAIRTIEGIENVVVVSEGEGRRGKRLIACCAPAGGAEISASDVRTACFDILPGRAVPDDIVFLKSLPLLPSGKVDRQKLTRMVGR